MGMFDYVNYECDCPECGEKVNDFQTKDTNCLLETIDPQHPSLEHFYTRCGNCGARVTVEEDEPPVFHLIKPRTFTIKARKR